MPSCFFARSVLVTTALTFAMTGCSVLQPDAHLAAFSTQMTGLNEVPPVVTPATGQVNAVLDKNTNLLRWQLSFTGLSGPATGGFSGCFGWNSEGQGGTSKGRCYHQRDPARAEAPGSKGGSGGLDPKGRRPE